MNKFIISITFIFTFFWANHLISSSLLKQVEKGDKEPPKKRSKLLKATKEDKDPGDSKISQIPKGTSSKFVERVCDSPV